MDFIKRLDTEQMTDADYATYRYSEIDNRTGELILEGFTYDSRVFSSSENAQRNLLGVFVAQASLEYPLPWNVKDDSETYNLADAAAVTAFFNAALVAKKGHQDDGTTLKGQIRDAVDRAAAELIIDNR